MYHVYIVYILTVGTIVSNLGKQCLSLIVLKYYLSTFNWLKKMSYEDPVQTKFDNVDS